jgi:hypothetical protein
MGGVSTNENENENCDKFFYLFTIIISRMVPAPAAESSGI